MANEIPVPSIYASVKGFAKKAVSKVEPFVRNAHATSGRDMVANSFSKAERVAGEVAGITTAAVRSTAAAVVGISSGLIFGLRGASVTQLKKMRLNVDKFDELGVWELGERDFLVDEETGELATYEVVNMDLHSDPYDPTKPAEKDYYVQVATGTRSFVQIENENVRASVYPINQPGTHETIGFFVCLHDDSHLVYRWMDV